nr:1,4-alpha-glucan branching protein GlgB [uncultured Oribacterium sp.]
MEGFLSELDRYLFGNGRHYKIYEKMGAHPACFEGQEGIHFAVWAPHAKRVSIVCDRNGWDPERNPMLPLESTGIYEGFYPGMGMGELYKYAILTEAGEWIYKADPYAFAAEFRPGTASITADLSDFPWADGKWMEERKKRNPEESPLSVYEVHLGSWKRCNRPENNGFINYIEAGEQLAEYCNYMGYTHVELMGIAEHPFDGSWGYQVTGYYAPTSRYGNPRQFMEMVNILHQHGIGVILDWVPAHFPKDAHGLADFDGTACYEHPDSRLGEHPDWGTKVFNYEKTEVQNFLIGNALYWYDMYHIDGLRVDAVASMLYLDYGRRDGEWLPNIYGGNGNLAAIEFFKHLNSIIRKREDGTVIIAEESTAWPDITKSPDEGGLGFHFKWNMGWMHDFLSYMKEDPMYRNYHHNQLTFGMSYAYSEKFILVLSHDEVVHLKRSMIEKMPGSREQKFRNLKAAYFFMMGHAGKKLLFMGQDFGQYREWNEDCSIDWHLLEEQENRSLHFFLRDLLQLYKSYPALYEADYLYEGFSWVNADDASRSIYSFIRNPKNHLALSAKAGGKNGAAAVAEEGNIVEDGNKVSENGNLLEDGHKVSEDGQSASTINPKQHRESLLFVVNMTPVDHEEYWVGMPKAKEARLLFTEEGLCKEEKFYPVVKGECDGRDYHIAYPLKGFGCALFAFTEEVEDSCANALSQEKEENLQVSGEKPEGQQEKKESSKVVEKTVEKTAEKAVEKTTEKAIEKNVGKHAEKTTEKTAENLGELRVREEAG